MTSAHDDDIRLMVDSKYIGAWDLRGRDVTVTIARIVAGKVVGEGGKTDRNPLIHLKGWDKPLVCNATMRKTLFALYGTYSAKELQGKRITLYPTTCRGAAGGTVDCVRARNSVPSEPGVPQDAVGRVPMDQEMRRKQVEQARGVGPSPVEYRESGREPGEEG